MTTTPETHTIQLAAPIQREGGPVEALSLRRPVAGELRGLKVSDLIQGDISAVIAVLPRIATPFLTEQESAGIDPMDLGEIAGTIAGFFMTPAQKEQVRQLTGQGSPTG